jgi:hypothetical protein
MYAIPESLFAKIQNNIKLLKNAIKQNYSTELKMIYAERIENALKSCEQAEQS